MHCFLESGAQGWLFVVRHSLSSSKFCDVCGVSLFLHSSTDLLIDFSLIFINHRVSPVKMAIRGWPSRIYLHLEAFKLPLLGTPVAHQIVAGNSISVALGSNGSVPTMACFRYCFCWPSLVRFVEFIVFPQENWHFWLVLVSLLLPKPGPSAVKMCTRCVLGTTLWPICRLWWLAAPFSICFVS